MKLTADHIQFLRDEAEVRSCELRDDYSGRGMYGKQCFALVGEVCDCMHVMHSFIMDLYDNIVQAALDVDDGEDRQSLHVTKHAVDALVHELANIRMDSMGLSTVVYWPSITT